MKTFTNGNGTSNSISIKIDNETIYFYFDASIRHFKERKNYLEQHDYDYDSDEPSEPNYFYWIDIDEWNNPQRNWTEHMKEKNWFTKEMEQYINKQIKHESTF